MSRFLFYFLSVMSGGCLVGLFVWQVHTFDYASGAMPSVSLKMIGTTIVLSGERIDQILWLIFLVTALGANWARLVWYVQYREAGGKPARLDPDLDS